LSESSDAVVDQRRGVGTIACVLGEDGGDVHRRRPKSA
jgi:hypothetical protein